MLLCFFICPSLEARQRVSAPLQVLQDGRHLDSVGYDNCDMQTNGELLVMKLIQPGALVFDVGAHTGEWSLGLLRIQPGVIVHAFEPVPLLFKDLNTLSVIAHNFGLSDISGSIPFFYYGKHPVLSTLHRRLEAERKLDMIPDIFDVRLERLDTFCEEMKIEHIDFLKIDTEGHELNVLLGAEHLLKNQAIDFIQFEYGGCYLDSKTTLEQVYMYLKSNGYNVYRIFPFGLVKITKWRHELENFTYANYLAMIE